MDNQYSNRLLLLDYARIVTAFLVIFAHLLTKDNLRFYIYQFHMPLFFIISGMLYKFQNNRVCIVKNIKTIVVPFISFLLIPTTVGILINGVEYSVNNLKYSILGIIRSSQIPTNWVLWFLVVLFNLKVSVNILQKLKWYWGGIIYVILLIISLKVNIFFIGQTLMAFPLFYLGLKYRRYIIDMSNKPFFNYIFIPAFFIVFFIFMVNGRVSMNTWLYGNYDIKFIRFCCFYLNAIIGSLGIFSLCSFFSKFKCSLIVKVSNLAGALITIMCAQYMFIDIFNMFLIIESLSIIQILIISLVIMFLCYIFHKVLVFKVPFLLGKF